MKRIHKTSNGNEKKIIKNEKEGKKIWIKTL